MSKPLNGAVRKTAPLRMLSPLQPPERRGTPCTGRIVKLFTGQGHGFIRLPDEREIYFHRADLKEGTSINAFLVGDPVSFELYEDSVSGARALNVRPRRRNR